MSKIVQAQAFGKLYLLGEYAVVKGYPAILVGLNKGVTVTIEESNRFGLMSNKYNDELVEAEWNNNQLIIQDERYRLAMLAINVCLEIIPNPTPFIMSIHSELDNAGNQKYGLGSSSALIVAIIRGLSQFYCIERKLEEQFKLAVITQRKWSKHSSFGDLAASVYGGCLYYVKGPTDWMDQVSSTNQLLTQKWEGFIIEPLPCNMIPHLIGFSGTSASSTDLVKRVFSNVNHPQVDSLFHKASTIVEQAKNALLTNNQSLFLSMIDTYRNWLVDLAYCTNVTIETDRILQIIQVTHDCGGVAKSSGAGGGDCVIAYGDTSRKVLEIEKAWKELGIEVVYDLVKG